MALVSRGAKALIMSSKSSEGKKEADEEAASRSASEKGWLGFEGMVWCFTDYLWPPVFARSAPLFILLLEEVTTSSSSSHDNTPKIPFFCLVTPLLPPSLLKKRWKMSLSPSASVASYIGHSLQWKHHSLGRVISLLWTRRWHDVWR